MSSIDGITNSGSWAPVGVADPTTAVAGAATTTASAARGAASYNSVFSRAFHRNLDTIFHRAASPLDTDADSTGSPDLATAAASGGVVSAALTQRKELVDAQLTNSVSRLMDVATKLDDEYPLADLLKSASTGTWDPASFRPRNETEAKAFAQRMAIDMTEAAARLDIVKNELDAARLDAQTSPTTQARAKVTDLTKESARQMQYLSKLAGIVDNASDGAVSDIGDDALDGTTARVFTDVSTKDLAGEMHRMGFATDDIERMLGAGELSVTEQQTPTGDTRLRQISNAVAQNYVTNFLMKMWNDDRDKRKEEDAKLAKREQERAESVVKADQRHQVEALDRQRADAAAAARQQQAQLAYAEHRARMQQYQAG